MAIPLLELDDRKFADIVAELQAMIPSYAPAWTNHNLADPGIMILELFAWLTEALVYRINRVPETSRRRFMELLGAGSQPALPALLKLRVCACRDFTLARHTPLFAYPGDGRDAIPFETVEEVEFSPELRVRTLVVRQTELLTDVHAGKTGAVPMQFLLFPLEQPFALPGGDYPRPPYIDSAGQRWQYTPSLRSSGPHDHHFTIKRGRVVVFGDGKTGARPPAGADLVATWRTARRPGGWLCEQRLGAGSGKAWQTFQLSAPPLADDLQAASDLEPTMKFKNGSGAISGAHWRYSPQLLEIEGNWNEFTVEPWVNGIRFGGDGRGALPPPDADIQITYRATLGAFEPLGADTDFGFVLPPGQRDILRVAEFTVLHPGAAGASLTAARREALAVIKPVWRGVTSSDLSTLVLRQQPDTFSLQSRAGDQLACTTPAASSRLQHQPAKVGVLATPHPRHRLEDKVERLGRPLALSPDGCSLVTQLTCGPDTGTVWLWNMVAAQSPTQLPADGQPAITFSPDGSRLLIHWRQNRASLIDTATGQSLTEKAAKSSRLSPDGSRWLTVTGDKGFTILRAGDDGSAIARLQPHGVVLAAFSTDSRQLATLHAVDSEQAAGGWVLQLRSAGSGAPTASAVPLTTEIERMAFSPDGRLLLTVQGQKTLTVYRTFDAKRLAAFELSAPLMPGAGSLQFSPTGSRLLALCADAACLWSLRTYEQVARLAHDQPAAPVTGAVYSSDGLQLATYNAAGGVHLWRAQPGRLEARFNLGAPVKAVAFNAGATRLAAVNNGQAIRVWDLERAGRELLKIDGPGGAALSRAGRWVAWANDNLVSVWDIDAGCITATLHHSRRHPEDRVTLFAPESGLAADGSLLLTVLDRAQEQELCFQVWNAEQMREVQSLLDERRLIASEPAARGPTYEAIGIEAGLVRAMPPQQSPDELRNAAIRALYAFFDPLTGGPEGKGWTLGRPVYRSEVYQVLEQAPGIDHVESLCIFKFHAGSRSGRAGAKSSLEWLDISEHCLVNLVIDPAADPPAVTVRDPQRVPFIVPV